MDYCHHSKEGVLLSRFGFSLFYKRLTISSSLKALIMYLCPLNIGIWCWCEVDRSNKSLCKWRTWCRTHHWTNGMYFHVCWTVFVLKFFFPFPSFRCFKVSVYWKLSVHSPKIVNQLYCFLTICSIFRKFTIQIFWI